MPGHTYTELKRYADAAYQQEGSARVDHAYMIRDRVMPFEIHNYAHNNQWLCTSLSHIGRVRDAIAVARNLVEQPRDPAKNGPNDGGSPQRSGRARWSEILTRYELWDDLIAATTQRGARLVEHSLRARAESVHARVWPMPPGTSLDKLAAQIEALRKLTSSRGEVGARRARGIAAPRSRRRRACLRLVCKSHVDAAGSSGACPPESPEFRLCGSEGPGGRRQEPQPGLRPGRPGRDPARLRQRQRGARGLSNTRAARPLGRPGRSDLPATGRDRRSMEGRQDLGPPGRAIGRRRHRRDHDQPHRPDDTRPADVGSLPGRDVQPHRHHRRKMEPCRQERKECLA